MAETYTQDGLDYLYNSSYRSGTQLATFYAGLFVSQTQTTVPASTASGSGSGWTEVTASSGTYTRQAILAASIAAPATVGGSSRGSTWPAVTFTGFTTNPASPINGFGIFSGSVASTASPLYFANFDSGASRALASVSDTLQVTPATRGTP
jgi:hypothetical protein